jgi:hypothetical protein
MAAKDDLLVQVRPLLGTVNDCGTFLSDEGEAKELDLLRRLARTGRWAIRGSWHGWKRCLAATFAAKSPALNRPERGDKYRDPRTPAHPGKGHEKIGIASPEFRATESPGGE